MKRLDLLKRAGRNLKDAKIRTFLTSLSIAVGAFTITLAFAAGAGGQKYTNAIVDNSGDARSLSVMPKFDDGSNRQSTSPAEYGVVEDSTSTTLLNSKDIAKIRSINGVSDVKPAYSITAEYMARPSQKQYVTPVTIKNDKTKLELAAGALSDQIIPKGSVVIVEEYLSALGFASAEQAIGEDLIVRFVQAGGNNSKNQLSKDTPMNYKDVVFTIAAVSKKTDAVLYYQEQIQISPEDGKSIYQFQNKNQPDADKFYQAYVQVSKDADVSKVQNEIKSAGYDVYSLQDIRGALTGLVQVAQYGVAGFGLIALLAAVFGIVNTQYISVYERTQQIGLMKALGARSKDVGRLFRYEAAWVGFLGGIIGTIGAVLVGLLNPVISQKLELEPGTQLLLFQPLTSLIIIVSLIMITVVAGFLPSRKAAKLEPIEALRTE